MQPLVLEGYENGSKRQAGKQRITKKTDGSKNRAVVPVAFIEKDAGSREEMKMLLVLFACVGMQDSGSTQGPAEVYWWHLAMFAFFCKKMDVKQVLFCT